MSNSQSYSASWSSYSSFSSHSDSTSTDPNRNRTSSNTQHFSEESYSDPLRGTTTHRTSQQNSDPAIRQTVHVPPGGKPQITGYGERASAIGGHNGDVGRIEDVEEDERAEREMEKQYEERMEDEYAKREGGA